MKINVKKSSKNKMLEFFNKTTKRNIVIILGVGIVLIVLTFFLSNEMATFVIGPKVIPPKASFYFVPESGQADENESFNVDLMINTEGQNVVAASSYIQYDPQKIVVQNIDTTGSILGYEVENSIDGQNGLIKITRGQPGDGVSNDADDGYTGQEGKIATLSIKALGEGAARLNFLMRPVDAPNISRLIVDDGSGTDILSAVNHASFTIVKTPEQITLPTKIKMRIDLQGRVPKGVLFKVEVKDKNSSEVVYTYENVSSGDDGSVEITAAGVSQARYDLRIIVPKYLPIIIRDVSIPDDLVQFTPPKILAGNLFDRDTTINELDWGVMNRRWSTADADADINQDGVVNELDWGYMNRNWGKQGD